jgi:hypothetical protein
LNLSVNTGVGKQFIIRNKIIIENNNFIEHNKKALSLQLESAFFTGNFSKKGKYQMLESAEIKEQIIRTAAELVKTWKLYTGAVHKD